MPSLSAQLATVTEAIKNLRAWMTERSAEQKQDHDDLVALKVKVGEIEKLIDSINSMKRAMIITIVGAAATAIFGLVVAFFNMAAKGEPTP